MAQFAFVSLPVFGCEPKFETSTDFLCAMGSEAGKEALNREYNRKRDEINRLKRQLIQKKVAYWHGAGASERKQALREQKASGWKKPKLRVTGITRGRFIRSAPKLNPKSFIPHHKDRSHPRTATPGSTSNTKTNGDPEEDDSDYKHRQITAFKNLIRYDYCDRVRVHGGLYGVAEEGGVLVPLEAPTLRQDNIKWHGFRWVPHLPSGNLVRQNHELIPEPCRFFTRNGKCDRGSTCTYHHDPLRIRACPAFLTNNCKSRRCLLNHNLNEFNTPLCRYELDDKCTDTNCRYSHHLPRHFGDERYEIKTCRPFAVAGFCRRGRQCPFMHWSVCPDYEERGECCNTGCKLSHPITKDSIKAVSSEGGVVVLNNGEKATIVISSYTVSLANLLIDGNMCDVEIDGEDSLNNSNYVLDLASDSEDETEHQTY